MLSFQTRSDAGGWVDACSCERAAASVLADRPIFLMTSKR